MTNRDTAYRIDYEDGSRVIMLPGGKYAYQRDMYSQPIPLEQHIAEQEARRKQEMN